MQTAKFLIPLFTFVVFAVSGHADSFRECVIKGWTYAGSREIPYTLHIRYEPIGKKKYETRIASLTINLNGRKIVFPKNAFDGLWPHFLGTPSAIENTMTKDEYSLDFRNCGDAAKSFSLSFEILHSHLYKRQLTPSSGSELWPEVRIYDARGKILYDGACDAQGNPLKKSS